jgi:hypothetical protein
LWQARLGLASWSIIGGLKICAETSEGKSSVYYKVSDNIIHSTVSSLNRYYILCTAHPDAKVSRLARKYGRFMIRINSPSVLLDRVKLAWQTNDLAVDRGAFMIPVEYTKDELRDADPYLLSPPQLTYSQKRKSYEEDREHRYFLKCKVDLQRVWENHLTLMLRDCAEICSAVTICTES